MDFISQLARRPASAMTESEGSVLPPGLAGAVGAEQILGSLRKEQLHCLARSYGIFDQRFEKLTHVEAVKHLAYRATEGLFSKPPANRWWYEKAKFNSDEVKNGKYNENQPGVMTRKIPGTTQVEYVPIPTLLPWNGPDPETPTTSRAAAKPKPAKPAAPMAGPSMAALRDRARELGISSFGKSRRDILSQISAAESATAATVEKDTTNA